MDDGRTIFDSTGYKIFKWVITICALVSFYIMGTDYFTAEAKTNSSETKNDYLLVVKSGFVIDEIESANIEIDSELNGSYKYLSDVPTDTNSDTWVKYTPSKGNTIYDFENLTSEQYEAQKDEILKVF